MFNLEVPLSVEEGKRRAELFLVAEVLRSFAEDWINAEEACVVAENNLSSTLKALLRGILDDGDFNLRKSQANVARLEAKKEKLWKKLSLACRIARAVCGENLSADPNQYLPRRPQSIRQRILSAKSAPQPQSVSPQNEMLRPEAL